MGMLAGAAFSTFPSSLSQFVASHNRGSGRARLARLKAGNSCPIERRESQLLWPEVVDTEEQLCQYVFAFIGLRLHPSAQPTQAWRFRG
jgi:hypothetical protein